MGCSVTSINIKLVGSSNRGLKSTLSRFHDLISNTGYFHFVHTHSVKDPDEQCSRHLSCVSLCLFSSSQQIIVDVILQGQLRGYTPSMALLVKAI